MKPSYFFRTAHLIGWLKEETGQGYMALEKRIRQNQYERFGLNAPAPDTVRDYFRLKRSPAIDPQDGETAPWLMAAEMEVPGAGYAFFHPIFDLLIGPLESSFKWTERLQRIPTEWIDEAKARGDSDQAEEWISFNKALTNRPGRKKKNSPIPDLEFIHKTLMRLPDPFFSILFKPAGFYKMFARTYLPVQEEVSQIQAISGIDSFTFAYGLLLEASEIGDTNRFAYLKEIIPTALDSLIKLPECRYFPDEIKLLVENTLPEEVARSYPCQKFYGYGLPATWRATECIEQLNAELDILIQKDNPMDEENN